MSFASVFFNLLLVNFFCAKKKKISAKPYFLCQKKKKTKEKQIFNRKVASHILCSSFVCKLPHECEDITKIYAWRTPLNAQCCIEYRLQYSVFFTFLNYHRNRLYLYFLVNYRISIISLLFWVSIPNPAY